MTFARAKIWIVIFLLVFTFGAQAASSVEPQTSTCSEAANGGPLFLTAYVNKDVSQQDIEALGNACHELEPTMDQLQKEDGIFAEMMNTIAKTVASGFGVAMSSFSKLRGSETQREYKQKLEAIKSIQNPMVRIQKVYELASSYQGIPDLETLGARADRRGKYLLALTPNNLLDSAKEEGSAGVCRQFASLLYWSLLQVSRWRDSSSAALSEADFSPELIFANSTAGPHAWVRVNLPKRDESTHRILFEQLDLDTTWYPKHFTPLMPRKQGLSAETRRKNLEQCNHVLACLTKKADPTSDTFLYGRAFSCGGLLGQIDNACISESATYLGGIYNKSQGGSTFFSSPLTESSKAGAAK